MEWNVSYEHNAKEGCLVEPLHYTRRKISGKICISTFFCRNCTVDYFNFKPRKKRYQSLCLDGRGCYTTANEFNRYFHMTVQKVGNSTVLQIRYNCEHCLIPTFRDYEKEILQRLVIGGWLLEPDNLQRLIICGVG